MSIAIAITEFTRSSGAQCTYFILKIDKANMKK